MQTITSPANPYIKHLVKLSQDASYRKETGMVLLEGRKLIAEIGPKALTGKILATDESHFDPACSHLDKILLSDQVAAKIASTESSENVFAEIPFAQSQPLKHLYPLIALDAVNDPGNLGTLLRTALALGWKGAFLLPGCCDPWNSKALRASKGALFSLPYQKGTWKELQAIIDREELVPLAAELDGKPLKKQPDNKIVLVLGNEANGVSQATRDACQAITIPMSDQMESLNVAQAGAILMYVLRN